MSRLAIAFSILLVGCFCLNPRLPAHEPDDHADSDQGQAVPKFPPALVLPALDGPKPWSDKPVLNDPDRFHIAIMTDNTGGHRPGIWMKAVRRLNMLRPEFVMSVGDLIEGYSENPQEVEAQWEEFLGFIDQLEMRFFFVAGNHDLSNPLMHKIWREHFGPEWYSFDYRGVHFVCLSSEDAETRIGDEQLAWIQHDLDQHQDARWTLLFFHQPLWSRAEREIAAGNPDPTNWKRVEAMLGQRPHTVFAGHVHHYVQYDRNGMKYYHLATTGGGSQLRGVPYGEFDHVTWLTMEKDGPYVTNLLLDGILPADAVTEDGIARFRSFLAQTQLEIAPILVEEEQSFSQGRVDMRFVNGFDAEVEVTGQIQGLPLRGLTVDPAALTLTAAPGKTADLAVDLRFAEPMTFDHLASTLLVAKLKTVGEDQPLTAERQIPVIIDQGYPCPPAPESFVLDGQLDEWGKLALASGEQPLVLGPAQQWQGPGDASIRFGLAHDRASLYFAAQVTDDAVIKGDGVELRLDPRPIDARRADNRLGQDTNSWRVAAPGKDEPAEVRLESGTDLGSAALAARPVAGGYGLELAIPLDYVARLQGADWRNFQFTVVIADVDEAGQEPCRVVWRGTSEVDARNTNYGHFVRGK